MEEQIDIQYDKTIEWMISRRKVKEDWATTLRGIQAKVAIAKEQQISDEAARAFLAKHGDDLDFFKIEELWTLLEKSEEAKKKNMFGQYTSIEIYPWKQVLDLYRKNAVFLVEGAKCAVQNTRYDIPAVKNQAQNCRKQVQDATRRQQDLAKTEAENKRKFRETCDRHQIPGVQFRAELQERTRSMLPGMLDRAASAVTDRCTDSLEYYAAFCRYTLDGKGPKEADLLPMMRFVQANGNAPLKDAAKLSNVLQAEWKKVQAECNKNQGKPKSASADAGGISWDVAPAEDTSADAGISWDISVGGAPSAAADAGGISWDFEVEDSTPAAAEAAPSSADAGGIDWGSVSLEGIDVGVSGAADEAASMDEGADGFKLLASTVARGMLVDEVLELEAFLAHRLWEMEDRGDADLVQSGNVEIQRSIGDVKKLHASISEVVDLLCGKEVQSLLLLQSSEAALDHAVAQLATLKSLSEKPGRQSAILEKRKAELTAEAETNTKEASALREGTQKLRLRLEEEISKLMKHKVRIVGDINTV